MTLRITKEDEAILNGQEGKAAELAMRVIVKLADVVKASSLISVKQVHIDACTFLTDSGIEFIEKLVHLGGKVKVPSTTNPLPINLGDMNPIIYGDDYFSKVQRVKSAYTALGTFPSWTCAPYQEVQLPEFGEQVAWGESNAIAYLNSVIGARTERYPDYFDICAALTGRVPYFGLHKSENRRGQILFSVEDVPADVMESDVFFVAMGYIVGKETSGIPVINGIQKATKDQLKKLGAAAASSGAVGLFHIIGITPEAMTFEQAFKNHEPLKEILITEEKIQTAIKELSHNNNIAEIDVVLVGCPHASLDEIELLDRLLQRTEGSNEFRSKFFLQLSPNMEKKITETGFKERFMKRGGKILVGTCLFHLPYNSQLGKHFMTNSGKFAYYAPGELNTDVSFGSLEQCFFASINGRKDL